jgi:hypothetical protein
VKEDGSSKKLRRKLLPLTRPMMPDERTLASQATAAKEARHENPQPSSNEIRMLGMPFLSPELGPW